MSAPAVRLLCAFVLALPSLGAAGVLATWAPRYGWWQHPLVTAGLALVAASGALRGELRPELGDAWLAERVRRYAPAAVGLVGAAGLCFPTFGSWSVLWLLFYVDLVLLAFSSLPRVRAVCLVVVSALCLGALVLDERAWFCLPLLGLAWLGVPALVRWAAGAGAIPRPARTSLLPLAGACAPYALCGVVVFGLAVGLLPPSTRDYVVVDLLAPRGTARASRPTVLPPLPGWELFAAWAGAGLALYVAARLRERAERARLARPAPQGRGGPVSALPAAPARVRASAWPEGPRRRLVERYLQHLERLERAGLRCPRDQTPSAHAQRIGRHLTAGPRAAALRLAALFGRARWAPEAVTAADAASAEAEARAVEDALLPPT